MKVFRAMKTLALLFALFVVIIGGFTITTAGKVEAARCCWVMVCTIEPPIYCWEVCKPCPKFP